MHLAAPQYQQLHSALLASFDKAGLRLLVRCELDADLEAVAGGQTTTEVVTSLIAWAERTGRVNDLISGALRQNPTSPALQALSEAAQSWQLEAPAAQGQAVADDEAKSKSRVSVLMPRIVTIVVVPVLLIVLGLYLEHNTSLFGGPTRNSPSDEQPAGASQPAANDTSSQQPTAEPSTAREPTLAPAESLRAASPVTPTIGTTRTNPIDGAVYVYVPAGPFLMGSREDDPVTYDNERPQRTVELEAFWIMQTEVTNAQYSQCVGAGQCPEVIGVDDPEKANYPVNNIGWHDAYAYAAWAGGRLPTEEQWEKACRGTSGQRYPWGNESPSKSLARYGDSNPVEVGSYREGASPYGALDMSGNVWEWTLGPLQNLGPKPDVSVKYSRLNDDYYLGDFGNAGNGERIMRGGAYDSTGETIRCALRPSVGTELNSSSVGFRIARFEF